MREIVYKGENLVVFTEEEYTMLEDMVQGLEERIASIKEEVNI